MVEKVRSIFFRSGKDEDSAIANEGLTRPRMRNTVRLACRDPCADLGIHESANRGTNERYVGN